MKRWLIAIVAVVALAFVPGAFAETREPAQLVDAVRITVQGQHVVGGCRYEGTVVLAPGQSAVEQHEIWEDPATCTMVMEQGTPVGSRFQSDRDGVASLGVDKKATTAGAPQGVATATATTHSAGYSRTWVEDPAGIDVNSVQNDIDWFWDGVYLTPDSTVTCSAEYQWFAPSGWGLHENDLQCNFDSPTYPQSWIDSTSFVHFKNGIFCFFTDTDVYYDRNHAIGHGNGNLVGQWSVIRSGTCAGLLSVHNRTERTLN